MLYYVIFSPLLHLTLVIQPLNQLGKPGIGGARSKGVFHSTLNTQHSTLNTQHSTLNTQHSTLNQLGKPWKRSKGVLQKGQGLGAVLEEGRCLKT